MAAWETVLRSLDQIWAQHNGQLVMDVRENIGLYVYQLFAKPGLALLPGSRQDGLETLDLGCTFQYPGSMVFCKTSNKLLSSCFTYKTKITIFSLHPT